MILPTWSWFYVDFVYTYNAYTSIIYWCINKPFISSLSLPFTFQKLWEIENKKLKNKIKKMFELNFWSYRVLNIKTVISWWKRREISVYGSSTKWKMSNVTWVMISSTCHNFRLKMRQFMSGVKFWPQAWPHILNVFLCYNVKNH